MTVGITTSIAITVGRVFLKSRFALSPMMENRLHWMNLKCAGSTAQFGLLLLRHEHSGRMGMPNGLWTFSNEQL